VPVHETLTHRIESSGYPYGISDVRIFVPAKFELASREALLTNDHFAWPPPVFLVDPVRHLIGSTILWGGLPEKDAVYLNIAPQRNDGGAAYKLIFHDVPVDGCL
jgi:hypothetical protein